jgi:hypothetical protein
MHHVVALALVMIALSDGAAVEVRKDSERAGGFLHQLSDFPGFGRPRGVRSGSEDMQRDYVTQMLPIIAR